MLQYATRTQAQQYFDGRLYTQAWDSASLIDQNKSLIQATTLIEQLNFAGDKTQAAQLYQFPRNGDTAVPQAIINACAEIALKLLDGVDVDREGKNVGVQEHNFTTVKTRMDTGFVQEWILAGIPSMTAWNFLKPFLNDPQNLILSRVD